jgi:hypothetical protein
LCHEKLHDNKYANLTQQDSITAATFGSTLLGISSLCPLKPTAATTCKWTGTQHLATYIENVFEKEKKVKKHQDFVESNIS